MNLEDIVCDLEYAKNLKDLGLNKRMLFRFHRVHNKNDDPNYPTGGMVLNDSVNSIMSPMFDPTETYSVAELGEMLPDCIIKDAELYNLTFNIVDDWFEYWYAESLLGGFFITKHDKKEANARAKLLIWLIENDHVNVEELNK